MRKKLSVLFAMLVLTMTVLSIPGTAYSNQAVDISDAADSTVTVARAEETTWYFRINNGVGERRLWSITYSRWLTDWQAY